MRDLKWSLFQQNWSIDISSVFDGTLKSENLMHIHMPSAFCVGLSSSSLFVCLFLSFFFFSNKG